MSEKVLVSFKTNKQDKERATDTFNSLGLNLSTAINIFLKRSITEGGLPFEVKDPFYSEANMKELRKRAMELENGTAEVEKHEIESE
ncbi:type II toxin-antitoxin system RelB/DinJ family antitoxin [Companilactobacillus sp.]|jgi:DNA-damage-inducible protein J|uniref:type II toxin-antitoxin system RelB/DinJ family antitoxin n=1 Tax=Companilactobacillus sp. TaxID=2767905 RepID=UPI0025BADB4F|nr:type II toxin-antitoxin system RelB/DinJ family antitoxin [Companilactobacillus sp.]MCH4009894.1 type II toxin-antitoxin system RelB/DinJ family antitoxin [Companilactobacillus sp.]MCH4052430.1 type II toxin-antitoxin system RelB/DinJ family antitoxin [Companilactobacillus sp.]MCH4077836.1 type II toxin-antitoxin system RelB/DinJ family antitoxin [Companilactobacillus sp.]MCH4126412.1 type II toxin-antitoxin system RelB/DinJ family antitoxin [Companilactobacillus sp.]MCI1312734.1 type II to